MLLDCTQLDEYCDHRQVGFLRAKELYRFLSSVQPVTTGASSGTRVSAVGTEAAAELLIQRFVAPNSSGFAEILSSFCKDKVIVHYPFTIYTSWLLWLLPGFSFVQRPFSGAHALAYEGMTSFKFAEFENFKWPCQF